MRTGLAGSADEANGGDAAAAFDLLNLKIGDPIVVNVLGRNVTAKLTSLREIKWENLAINFVMVFTPDTLKGAPHNLARTCFG